MKDFFFTFITLLTVSLVNFGQQKVLPPCNLTVNQAPSLRGFTLGQTKDEVFKRIPELISEYYKSLNDPENKSVGVSMVFLTNSYRENLTDVDLILHFLDGQIIYISLSYNEYEPDNLNMFINQVSETTKLPLENWKITGKFDAEMSCKGFAAFVWTGRDAKRPNYLSYPNLRLYDTNADYIIQSRKKEIERRKVEELLRKKRLEDERKKEELRKKKIFKP